MISIAINTLQHNLEQLIDHVNTDHTPIVITNGNGKGAILIGEQEWAAIKETLYLYEIPGMAQSIEVGITEPIDTCLDEKQIWQ